MKLLIALSLFACISANVTSVGAGSILVGQPIELSIDTVEAVALEFDTEVGKVYQIEFSGNLIDPWVKKTPPLLGTGAKLSQLVPTGGADRGFFRLRNDGDPSALTITCPVRKWQNVSGDRIISSNPAPFVALGSAGAFFNDKDYEIEVFIILNQSSAVGVFPYLIADGHIISAPTQMVDSFMDGSISGIVLQGTIPAKTEYWINGSGNAQLIVWNELK